MQRVAVSVEEDEKGQVTSAVTGDIDLRLPPAGYEVYEVPPEGLSELFAVVQEVITLSAQEN